MRCSVTCKRGGFLRTEKSGKIRNICREILPGASVLPLGCVLALNFLTYFFTRLFTSGWKHYSLALPLDDLIPFCTEFIWIYVLSYAVWGIGFLCVGNQEQETADELFAAEIIAKLLTLVFFLVLPTTLDRPVPSGNSLSDLLTRWIFTMDAPDNLFPSIHCLESWFCYRACSRMKAKKYLNMQKIKGILIIDKLSNLTIKVT